MSQPEVIKVFSQSKYWKEEIVCWEVSGTFSFSINKRELIMAYLAGIQNGEKRSSLFKPIY